MATMTLRIYKNELDIRVLNFVKEDSRFTILEEGERIINVMGEHEDLANLMLCEFRTAEDAKKIFPEIITQEDAEYMAKQIKEDILNEVRDNLIKMYNIGAHHTIEYSQLYNVWKNLK